MTDTTKTQAAKGELMTADEAEVRAILEARYPNDRRLQRAMIRLAKLRPEGRYSSMRDTADPAFQRIVALEAPSAEASKAPEPLALKAEPLVTTATTKAGPTGSKASASAPGKKST